MQDLARGGATLRQRDGEGTPSRRPQEFAGAGAGPRQADGPHGRRRAQRHARRGRGDARPDAEDVREHAERREAEESPAERAMRKQIGRARQAAARPAGAARRHLPQRPARPAGRSASPASRPDENRSGAAGRGPGPGRRTTEPVVQTRSGRRQSPPDAELGRAPAGAERPPRRIAAHAQKPRHEGREGLRRRPEGHAGGRGRPQGRQGGQGGAPKPGGKSGKGAAVDAQGRALEALREGAQGMQKQMGQGQGQERQGRLLRRAGEGPASARATTRSAADAKATWAATKARSGKRAAGPSAPAGCSRSCAAASPIRTARSRSATISNG